MITTKPTGWQNETELTLPEEVAAQSRCQVKIEQNNTVYTQAAKTGSLCCVAARPHGSTQSADGWSTGPNEPHWHINGGFAPPLPSTHEDSRSQFELLTTSSRTFPRHRRSLSSNSRGSRSWRRVDSSRLFGHHRTQSGSMFGASPSDSFMWNPLASSSGHIGDCAIAESDLAASPSTTISSSKEEHLSHSPSTVSNTPETTPSYINPMNLPSAPQARVTQPLPPQLSHSLLSKSGFLVPDTPLRREFGDARFTSSGPSRISPSEARRSFQRSSSSRSSSAGGSSDWSSLQGFSEMASQARQERLRWHSASSPSDFTWGVSREGFDRASGFMCMERIRAAGSQPASATPRSENCGVCARLLTQRSPWSSSRVMGYHECNVVGVLVCGHVYHAECLEQSTSEHSRQDPACPTCGPSEKSSAKEINTSETTPHTKVVNVAVNSFGNRSGSRNKLSRIGVVDDDIAVPESSRQNDALKPRYPLTSPSPSDPAFLSRSMSRRRFSFRNRLYRDSTSDAGWRKPGSSMRVSPDSSSEDLSLGGPPKRSRAFDIPNKTYS